MSAPLEVHVKVDAAQVRRAVDLVCEYAPDWALRWLRTQPVCHFSRRTTAQGNVAVVRLRPSWQLRLVAWLWEPLL